MDSIIARPTNKVRVMVADASGCCASELSAVATALPSASAGPMRAEADGDAGDDDRGHRDDGHAVHGVSFVWFVVGLKRASRRLGLAVGVRVAAAM